MCKSCILPPDFTALSGSLSHSITTAPLPKSTAPIALEERGKVEEFYLLAQNAIRILISQVSILLKTPI
jgi:hypothetical protein